MARFGDRGIFEDGAEQTPPRIHRCRDPVRLFREVELPLCGVLARMESCGIAVDREALAEMSRSMERRLAQLTERIFAEAGETFNIQSPKQLAVILFEKLKLPVIKRTKTGPSTDFDVLTKLAEQHPDRKSTRLNSSHSAKSRMPSSA